MSIIINIKKVVSSPLIILVHLARHWPFRYCFSDKRFTELFYRAYQHRPLDLDNPKSFSEKLQWLKLYDHNPRYTQLTDKYLVRDYVKEAIGEQHLIPLLGKWERVDDIDFSLLPSQFVLKCSHDSGSTVICKDKVSFDKRRLKKLRKRMKFDYYWASREYNYKGIERRILAEKYMLDHDTDDLQDYKVFCFDGTPKFIQVDKNRFGNHTREYYTSEWKPIPVMDAYTNRGQKTTLPPSVLKEMLQIASKLSAGFCHVRIDLYYANGNIYFGEMTFHDGSGGEPIEPFTYDLLWGSYLHLPEKSIVH